MTPPEQRNTERFSVELPIVLRHQDVDLHGVLTDLSLGGGRVRVDGPASLSVGARVRVHFCIPTAAQALEADAEVRWQTDLDRSLLGFQFVTGFRAKETWALNRFLDGLERVSKA